MKKTKKKKDEENKEEKRRLKEKKSLRQRNGVEMIAGEIHAECKSLFDNLTNMII